jgi:hypothetical protein
VLCLCIRDVLGLLYGRLAWFDEVKDILNDAWPTIHNIDSSFVRFLFRVEAGYLGNPYHNSTHVAHVTHRMYMIMTAGGFTPHYADSSTLLATILAAVRAEMRVLGVGRANKTLSLYILQLIRSYDGKPAF